MNENTETAERLPRRFSYTQNAFYYQSAAARNKGSSLFNSLWEWQYEGAAVYHNMYLGVSIPYGNGNTVKKFALWGKKGFNSLWEWQYDVGKRRCAAVRVSIPYGNGNTIGHTLYFEANSCFNSLWEWQYQIIVF